MSVSPAHKSKAYAPSDLTDGIVLAVLVFVCFTGMWLTAPDKSGLAPSPPTETLEPVSATTAPTRPDPAAPEPDPALDLRPNLPTDPVITPPADANLPASDPETISDETELATITPRPLAELSPREQIASGPGFISLMGTQYDATNWHRSTHAASSGFLATDWTADHAAYDADGLSLKIEHAPDRPAHFLGGEIQTRQSYGYGRYEVLMRPAKAPGTVSSFFTYTGPYSGNPHDEVDIEFLGADTTKIYLNYFRDGKVGEDRTIDLPFDAADAFHLYAFEWHRDGITWFIDGKPVHQTRPDDPRIPQTPGAIIVNLWTGKPKLYNWHGRPNFNQAQADYACISFQPIEGTTRSCSSIFPPEENKRGNPPGLIARALADVIGTFAFSEITSARTN